MNKLQQLQKKFTKLEKLYAKANGQPTRQKRLLRQAHSVQVKMEELINALPEIQKGGVGVKMEREKEE